MERVDVVVIGGGVTGLAAARALALRGRSVCVLERHGRPGLDTSTHNSGIIHAGIYYPTGSLKARLCVEGRHLLYDFCTTHNVPHQRCGKIIVASDDTEAEELHRLLDRGERNGVEGLTMIDTASARAREPHVRCSAALLSPETGIVDADALVKTLLRAGMEAGVAFLPGTRLLGVESITHDLILQTARERIRAAQVVNAAGLYADEVSALLHGETFTIYPCRGEYAELIPEKRGLVRALVYPVPHAHSLGVHFVTTTGGALWLGPTVKYLSRKDDYEGDRLSVDAFLEPARRLVPDITSADLRLGGSGIRAKLQAPDEAFADFLIRRDTRNPSVIQAAGIESPGLTSCLAIGNLVADIAGAS